MRFEQINLNQAGAGGGPEKGPEEFEVKDQQQQKPEKEIQPLPATKKPKEMAEKEKKEWLVHLYEELKKIRDLEKNTELQKIKTYKEATKLLNDWLPFGNLDDFKGIERLMEIMEENRPKTMVTFNYRKEKLAKRVAVEMALQWDKNEKDTKAKIQRINDFVNKWLKEKSYYYKRAEELKDRISKTSKAKKSKATLWLAQETSTLLKLLGERDRTLSEVAKILALQDIPYRSQELRKIATAIENQNIKNATLVKVREIEEMPKTEKEKMFKQIKEKLQTSPELPLKIEMYEQIYGKETEEEIKEKEKEKEEISLKELITKQDFLNLLLENTEIANQIAESPEGKALVEKVKNKIKEIKGKQQKEIKPEAVQKAKEYIEKTRGSKDKFSSKFFGLLGYGLLLLLVLFILEEIKLGETLTKGSFDFKSRK